jgi:metacaspase-1
MSKKAALCGINNYQSQTDLRGCVNDVKNMSLLLTNVFGFAAEQIHQLTNEQVTKAAILQEWQWLIQSAQPGDQLVFHFSGHGSYIPDDVNADEADGYDEITCLYDMNFHNPDTFIRDDEWSTMIQQVPQDVELTIIMDTCHSGTATKNLIVPVNGNRSTVAIDTQASAQSIAPENSEELESADYRKLLNDHAIVLSRFLVPPSDMQPRPRKARSTARIASPDEPETYLLITACRADETAADAYINTSFNGAFTYYLCQELRRSPQLDSEQLLETVKHILRTSQFAQEPQHEGKNRTTGLFSTKSNLSTNPKTDTQISSELPTMTTNNMDTATQQLLIQAYIQLLDTVAGSTASMGQASSPTMTTPGGSVGTSRLVGDRYLVCVHGISQHVAGYSNPWWSALQPYVGQIYGTGDLGGRRQEVLWSDLVNASRALEMSRAMGEDVEKERLRREIITVLQERQQQEIAKNTTSVAEARQAARQADFTERGGGMAIDDFLIYMTDSRMRQQIIDRFTKVIEPLLRNNNRIDIIGHSWGTVVAYEGLRELEKNPSIQGRVANLFTVGSALSILPVRAALRPENQNGRRPAFVDRWYNLDAKGDLVGGMIRDQFEITDEYLELDPTGCARGWFGYNLGCAHSSYFNTANATVNRDIFAKFILS